MKYVMPARQKINDKTIFNLLGPHTNPCSAKRQIIGVYNKKLLQTFCKVSKSLYMDHVLVVHGSDGLDEITITGDTYVSELKSNEISEYVISPKEFGLKSASFDMISAISPRESLMLVKEAFSGKNSPVQDMIALNSGAALYIAKIVNSINEGVELSFELMRNGNAANKLESYVEASNQS